MDHLELVARVTSHIPDKGQVTIRYFGLYANAHRGKVRESEELVDRGGVWVISPAFGASEGFADIHCAP